MPPMDRVTIRPAFSGLVPTFLIENPANPKGWSPKKKKGQHLCDCRNFCTVGPMNDTKPAANRDQTFFFFFFLETTHLGVPILY